MQGWAQIIRKFDDNNYITEYAWKDGSFQYNAVVNGRKSVLIHNDAMVAYKEIMDAQKAGA